MNRSANLKRTLIFLAVLCAIEYVIFHILYTALDGFNEYSILSIRLSLAVFPAVGCAALIKLSVERAWLNVLYISLVRVPFSYLYAYMYMIYTNGFSSKEAFIIAIPAALVIAIIYGALVLLAYALMRLVFKLKHIEFIPDNHLPIKATELSNPLTLGIALFPAIIFAIQLLFEIISTISYFIDYGAIYRPLEIVWMVFSYLFLLIQLIAATLLSCLLVNKLLINDRADGDNE